MPRSGKTRRRTKDQTISQVQVTESERLWVIYEPQTKQFVGGRWRENKYSMVYALGGFTGCYQCTSRKSARQTLNVVKNFTRYSVLTKEETARLEIRRVRARILVLEKKGE